MESIERILQAYEERTRTLRKKKPLRIQTMRSQSLVPTSDTQSVGTSHPESNSVMQVDSSPSKLLPALQSAELLVFSEKKLQEAYRKIDEFKMVQSAKEKHRLDKSPRQREATLPRPRETEQVVVSIGRAEETPTGKVQRQYSQEVVSALMQYRISNM